MIVVIQEDNVDCDDDDIIIRVIFNDNKCKWLVLHFIASQLHSCTVDALKCGGLYKHSLSLNMTRITYIIIINCKLSTMVVHVLASISKSDLDYILIYDRCVPACWLYFELWRLTQKVWYTIILSTELCHNRHLQFVMKFCESEESNRGFTKVLSRRHCNLNLVQWRHYLRYRFV